MSSQPQQPSGIIQVFISRLHPLHAGISTSRCLFMSIVCAAVEVYTVNRSQLKSKHL